MKIDRHTRQSAKKYFRACLQPDGSFDEQGIRDLVHLLATQKPRNYLGILRRLQQRLAQHLRSQSVAARRPAHPPWQQYLGRLRPGPSFPPRTSLFLTKRQTLLDRINEINMIWNKASDASMLKCLN
jgi:hypothetical protein